VKSKTFGKKPCQKQMDAKQQINPKYVPPLINFGAKCVYEIGLNTKEIRNKFYFQVTLIFKLKIP
jgi:hypothetical protein